jgi:glycosyltransferase involved in cell wall biosynthesis
MRICLYTDSALPRLGGQEFVVDALARQFTAAGHEAVVLAPQRWAVWPCNDSALPYHVERHPKFFSMRRVNWYRWWLLRCHRKLGFDILHCHGVYPPGYLAMLCRERLGIPTVITSHGGDIREGNHRLARPEIYCRFLRALQDADALVAISRFTRERLLRLCPSPRMLVDIPNGVDLQPFAARAPRPANLDPAIQPGQYILYLGRLKHRKGLDVLLEALALVPNYSVPSSRSRATSATPPVQLVIAGDGEENPALQAQAVRLGLQDRVRFVSAVFGSDKIYLLQNALATVLPSRLADAGPLVVLESFAAGVPVIGTRVPGLEDLIDEGKNGWLVPPESPRCLAEALARVLIAPHLPRALSDTVRQRVWDFSWPVIARRHLQLYETLLSAQETPASVWNSDGEMASREAANGQSASIPALSPGVERERVSRRLGGLARDLSSIVDRVSSVLFP